MNYNSQNKLKTRDIALYGLFTALVYVATRFINIPGITEGGLFHLGNVMAFTIAIVFGKKAGAISGALGMALFDITSAWFSWAPFTFVIRLAMGYIIGYMANKENEDKNKALFYTITGIVIASVIMIGGYYATEVILTGNLYTPIKSLNGNIMQCVVGTAAALPLSAALRSGFRSRNITTEM